MKKIRFMKTILISAAILFALPVYAETYGGDVGDPENIKPAKRNTRPI